VDVENTFALLQLDVQQAIHVAHHVENEVVAILTFAAHHPTTIDSARYPDNQPLECWHLSLPGYGLNGSPTIEPIL